MTTVVIIKIGEDLSSECNSERLHQAEPEAFATALANQGIRVLVHSTESLISIHGSVCRFSSIEEIERLTTHVDAIFLWQGYKFKRLGDTNGEWVGDFERNGESYKIFNGICTKFLVKSRYFVQTDLRLPLIDINKPMFNPLFDIDTTKITLLSQAKIDYRSDIKVICDNSMTENLKSATKSKFYTKFKDFKHLQLGVLPALKFVMKPRKFNFQNRVVFFTQGYNLLVGKRKELFRLAFCSTDNEYCSTIYGTHSEESNIQLLKDLNHKIPHSTVFEGKLPWQNVIPVLNASYCQVCINNEYYEKYELIPNRIFETIAGGCLPILLNCSSAKSLDNELFDIYSNLDLTDVLDKRISDEIYSTITNIDVNLRTHIIELLQVKLRKEIHKFENQLKHL